MKHLKAADGLNGWKVGEEEEEEDEEEKKEEGGGMLLCDTERKG